MPFKYMSDLAKDEGVVKAIFDNIRNVGICGAITAAAQWTYHSSPSIVLNKYFSLVSAGLLYATAFCLFFINMQAAMHKLNSASAPKWARALLGGVYGGAIGALLTYFSRPN